VFGKEKPVVASSCSSKNQSMCIEHMTVPSDLKSGQVKEWYRPFKTLVTTRHFCKKALALLLPTRVSHTYVHFLVRRRPSSFIRYFLQASG